MQKIRRLFYPWKYIQELDTVNDRSRQGFHLVSSTPFSRTEEENSSVTYYYRLDVADKQGITELLYETQGWELVCRQNRWRWFRKPLEDSRMDSEYELHGEERHAIADHLHSLIRPLDLIRNILLVAALILLLIPGELTANWTPRIAALPLFICILPVKIAENMRKTLGEHKRT